MINRPRRLRCIFNRVCSFNCCAPKLFVFVVGNIPHLMFLPRRTTVDHIMVVRTLLIYITCLSVIRLENTIFVYRPQIMYKHNLLYKNHNDKSHKLYRTLLVHSLHSAAVNVYSVTWCVIFDVFALGIFAGRRLYRIRHLSWYSCIFVLKLIYNVYFRLCRKKNSILITCFNIGNVYIGSNLITVLRCLWNQIPIKLLTLLSHFNDFYFNLIFFVLKGNSCTYCCLLV